WIDVGENGGGPGARDRLGGRIERERRADDLVAGADLEGVEDEDDRVRAVADAHRLGNAEVARGLLLERGDVRPQDELTALQHLVDGLPDPWEERRVLRLDVDQR